MKKKLVLLKTKQTSAFNEEEQSWSPSDKSIRLIGSIIRTTLPKLTSQEKWTYYSKGTFCVGKIRGRPVGNF